MAHLAFIWELGLGMGHVAPYRALLESLLRDGHRATYFAREPARAQRVLEPLPVTVTAAPHAAPLPPALRVRPLSLAGILWNCGFADTAGLRTRVAAWRDLLHGTQPDIIVADHSPTALLAVHTLGRTAFVAGSGFMVPPMSVPLPAFRWWEANDLSARQAEETRVLTHANAVIREFDATPLPHLAALLCPPGQLLRTFAELDHYPTREQGRFLGSLDGPARTLPCRWPAGDGPRVFVYMRRDALLAEALAALTAAGARVCAYVPDLDDATRTTLAHPAIAFANEPLSLDTAGDEIDLAVTNCNFNTVARLLLAGVPQLAISVDIEKYMLGRRLEALGAGLCVPRTRAAILPEAVAALLRGRDYRRAAARFAARYAGLTLASQTQAMRGLLGVEGPAANRSPP